MTSVLTLISDGSPGILNSDTIAMIRGKLEDHQAGLGETDWLADGEACDIPFEGVTCAQIERLIGSMGLPLDAVTTQTASRRKRLLVADMDSTIVTAETLDELADFAGLKQKIAGITARAMNGELDFEAALDERVTLLTGLGTVTLEQTWDRITFTPGARTLVATMSAHGAVTALVSGGFTFFTEKVREELGFTYDQANVLHVADGKLVGTVQKPVLDKQAKVAALNTYARAHNLTPDQAISVGDGANDLPMLKRAGIGVAYHAKPAVRTEARVRINHGDLTSLLYLQGYRKSEFVTRI